MLSLSKINLIIVALGACFIACNTQKAGVAGNNFVKFVDPLIGTGGHGHVFVGASVPHGMVQIGPNNLSKGWD